MSLPRNQRGAHRSFREACRRALSRNLRLVQGSTNLTAASPAPGASVSCLTNFFSINPVPIIPRLSFPGIVLQVAGSGLFQPILEGLNGIDNLFRVVTKNSERERFWSMRRADIMMLSLYPSVSCSHGAGLDV